MEFDIVKDSTYHYLGTHQLVFKPLLALKDDVIVDAILMNAIHIEQ